MKIGDLVSVVRTIGRKNVRIIGVLIGYARSHGSSIYYDVMLDDGTIELAHEMDIKKIMEPPVKPGDIRRFDHDAFMKNHSENILNGVTFLVTEVIEKHITVHGRDEIDARVSFIANGELHTNWGIEVVHDMSVGVDSYDGKRDK